MDPEIWRRVSSKFGQTTPPITKYIRGILRNYPDGEQILKEMLQNADDGGATEFRVLFDDRQHGTTSLLHSSLSAGQGPALVVFNNAVFEEEDWQNLQRIADSSKVRQIVKTGRFGLGFNSVYHLTDLPTIVTGKRFGIFDPHTTHVPNGATGWSCDDFVAAELFRLLPDQLGVLHGVFGADMHCAVPGSFFRLPLRTSGESQISTPYPAHKVAELLRVFQDEAHVLLLFLKSVRRIELYRWDPDTNAPLCTYRVQVEPDSAQDCLSRTLLPPAHVRACVSSAAATVPTHTCTSTGTTGSDTTARSVAVVNPSETAITAVTDSSATACAPSPPTTTTTTSTAATTTTTTSTTAAVQSSSAQNDVRLEQFVLSRGFIPRVVQSFQSSEQLCRHLLNVEQQQRTQQQKQQEQQLLLLPLLPLPLPLLLLLLLLLALLLLRQPYTLPQPHLPRSTHSNTRLWTPAGGRSASCHCLRAASRTCLYSCTATSSCRRTVATCCMVLG
eukprot:gnl/Spiro4/10273_TR5464_c0_g1_i1.p1 gnl/Spiro4/10273_TR5464_c0_g1~~gnl/Spiro4/10273_TR5464_c0_g1_i1.p1  ORF type:complete len:501 (-),score=114.46 gnl/Spiro4/10273_TR5464_c0_g1_i1:152-1654(-)